MQDSARSLNPSFLLQYSKRTRSLVAYSDEQIKDLMQLRQLFYSKIGQLCRERPCCAPWHHSYNRSRTSAPAISNIPHCDNSHQIYPFVRLQAVVAYSEDQIKDLMQLRQLFYSKVGQLCRERKALLRRMANEQEVGANIGLDDVSVRLSEVSDLADQLRANGADEYRTYMQFSSAFSRGVSLHSCHV